MLTEERNRWTEADWKERWGNYGTLFLWLFHIYSGGPTQSFHFSRMEKGCRRAHNMLGCFLFLSCLLSLPAPPSSCHESPLQTHTYTLALKHTQRSSGYAYYMSSPPLKASLPFSFRNLEQRWWGGSQILHSRAVSLLYCRNLLFTVYGKPVCCSLKHQYVIQ